MELNLNELERLAESATQGPWIACGPSFGTALPKYLNEVVVDNPDSEDDGIEICQPPTGLDEESSRDMEFIGAANPSVVLELVRRLREAEKDAARLDFLERRRLETDSAGDGNEEPTFGVHRVSGGRNDREWHCLGRGETLRAAIDTAMQSTKGATTS